MSLVSYWKLNGNSNDALGYANGTDISISYIAGKNNQCASFAGGTSSIAFTVGSSFNAASYTISILFKSTFVGSHELFEAGNIVSGTYSGNWIELQTGTIRWVRFTTTSTSISLSSIGTGYNDGKWHLLECVFNNAVGGNIFIDGKLENSDSTTTAIRYAGTQEGGIGVAYYPVGTKVGQFTGQIDEVSFNTSIQTTAGAKNKYSFFQGFF